MTKKRKGRTVPAKPGRTAVLIRMTIEGHGAKGIEYLFWDRGYSVKAVPVSAEEARDLLLGPLVTLRESSVRTERMAIGYQPVVIRQWDLLVLSLSAEDAFAATEDSNGGVLIQLLQARADELLSNYPPHKKYRLHAGPVPIAGVPLPADGAGLTLTPVLPCRHPGIVPVLSLLGEDGE